MLARLLGRLLSGVHAGEEKLLWNRQFLQPIPQSIEVSSPAFRDGGAIPARYAAGRGGENKSPPLAWTNLPKGTHEIVLVVEDPDAPIPTPWVHLIATGIPPQLNGVPEGALNKGAGPFSARLGKGTMGKQGYAGPTPPPGHGPHRYVFQVLALDRNLDAAVEYNRKVLVQSLPGKVLARGKLVGIFERK